MLPTTRSVRVPYYCNHPTQHACKGVNILDIITIIMRYLHVFILIVEMEGPLSDSNITSTCMGNKFMLWWDVWFKKCFAKARHMLLVLTPGLWPLFHLQAVGLHHIPIVTIIMIAMHTTQIKTWTNNNYSDVKHKLYL